MDDDLTAAYARLNSKANGGNGGDPAAIPSILSEVERLLRELARANDLADFIKVLAEAVEPSPEPPSKRGPKPKSTRDIIRDAVRDQVIGRYLERDEPGPGEGASCPIPQKHRVDYMKARFDIGRSEVFASAKRWRERQSRELPDDIFAD